MDKDEEAGLRAFVVDVECSVDSAAGCIEPVAITVRGVRRAVVRVIARWCEEERVGFRVSLADGACMLLYYVAELDVWSGVEERRAPGPRIDHAP